MKDAASTRGSSGAPGLRIAVVGASSGPVCGVRDYARVTAEALSSHGARVTTLWWERDESWGFRRTAAEARAWLDAVDEAVDRDKPEWILWHYSVFTWGGRGIPYLAPMVARRLARTEVPVLAVLHEFAFPFGEGGLGGTVWALAHRAALVPVLRGTTAVIVTTEDRALWLRSRRWLPLRPVSFLPVCSNLPVVPTQSRLEDVLSVGVFGFAAGCSLVEEVTAALTHLRDAGLKARLVLVGAPGSAGPDADAWRNAASSRGFDSLAFTGVLGPDELARALASVDVALLADRAGPMSRKTTLAAALALGRPVVAVDGPKRWGLLANERAVVLAQPTSKGISTALEPLLRNEGARRKQGERGKAFYSRWMTPERLASEMLAFLAAIGGRSDSTGEHIGPFRRRRALIT